MATGAPFTDFTNKIVIKREYRRKTWLGWVSRWRCAFLTSIRKIRSPAPFSISAAVCAKVRRKIEEEKEEIKERGRLGRKLKQSVQTKEGEISKTTNWVTGSAN